MNTTFCLVVPKESIPIKNIFFPKAGNEALESFQKREAIQEVSRALNQFFYET
jgi:hypothetical protein